MEGLDGRILLCLSFSVYICYIDWKVCRIPNKAVLIFSALGITVNTCMQGVHGILSSVTGGAVAMILFPLFALRMLGAGDVKALMTIGMLLGPEMAFKSILYSLFWAGVFALVLMLVRKNGIARLKYFFRYLKNCYLTKTLQPYVIPEEFRYSENMFRFSFGIVAGVLTLLIELFI